MYGWFEPGGGVNKYFNYTTSTDILLRSAYNNNKIVIGNNSNTNAGIYIHSNNVGIKKTPDTNYALDVNGNTKLQTTNIGDNIELNSNAFVFGNVCTINHDGLIKNDFIITDNVKHIVKSLYTVTMQTILGMSTNIFRITFAFYNTLDSEYMKVNRAIKIDKYIFKIINKVSDNIYDVQFIRNITVPFPFNNGFVITELELLDDIYEKDIPITLSAFFTIDSFSTTNLYSKTLYVTLSDIKYKNMLNKGEIFSFKWDNIDTNILVLEDTYFTPESLQCTLTLRTVDYSPFPLTSFPSIVVELVLNAVTNPPSGFIETNIVLNSYVSNIVEIQNSIVDSILNIGENNPRIIKYIYFDDNIVSVENVYGDGNGNILVEINPSTPLNYPSYPEFADIRYDLNLIPLKVVNVQEIVSDNHFKCTVEDPFNKLKESTQNLTFYLADTNEHIPILNIQYLDNVIYTEYDLTSFIGKFIYVLPYRTNTIHKITQNNCYIGAKLGIGTDIPSETLTVKGDASVQNKLVFYNQNKSDSFVTKYENNTFSLSDKVEINSNATYIYQDAIIKANCVAVNFLNYSDRRIKKNIQQLSPEYEKEIIKNLNIYEYEYKGTNNYDKGMIAQEVEQYMPHAISNSLEVLYSICKTCKVSTDGIIVIENIQSLDEKSDLAIGTPVQIILTNGTHIISKIIYINYTNSTIYMKLQYALDSEEFVHVVGPYTNVKRINYNMINMTLISAVKSLLKDVESMKQDKI
jgi:hypothetical protein